MPNPEPSPSEPEDLRRQLEDLEAALRAITSGDVDLLMVGDSEAPGTGTRYLAHPRAEHPYRQIVEGLGAGVATVSPRGLVLFANGRLAAMLEQPPGRIAGQPLRGFVAPRWHPELENLMAVEIGEHRSARVELAQGLPVLLAASAFPIEGTVVRCLVVLELPPEEKEKIG